MDKHDVARVLDEIGVLLELRGANPFRIRAYHKAAHTLENIEEDLQLLVVEKRLEELPGIGKDLAHKITTLVKKGRLPFYERLKKTTPPSLFELLEIPGLGGRKIKILYDKLGIKTVEDLTTACQSGRVAKLKGFGKRTEENLLRGIKKLKTYGKRTLWWKALATAQPILDQLLVLKEVKQAEVAGSLRRKLETIGDLDFLVASAEPEVVNDWFTTHPHVERVVAKGPTRSQVRLRGGMQADLRVVTEEEYGYALIYLTGSRDHNIKLRLRAHKQGLMLSEYALEPLDKKKRQKFAKKQQKKVSEEEIYQALGLAYIPPELREDMGEIEAAEKNALPKLIKPEDIQGVFHCHTTDSDGHNTLEEMVTEAQTMGLKYIGISDHSKSSYQANGMDEARLFEQVERIRKLNKTQKFSTHVFAGLECDILLNGDLDFPDSILKELDFVIVSVHRWFKLDEKTMTARLIKAIENPYTTIVGHLSGRLLLTRDPYPLNVLEIIAACKANGKIIELNAYPTRLDMDWRYWHIAKENGVKCSIDPDAHSTRDLHFYLGGVDMARKGWLEKKDVVTTLPLDKMKTLLQK